MKRSFRRKLLTVGVLFIVLWVLYNMIVTVCFATIYLNAEAQAQLKNVRRVESISVEKLKSNYIDRGIPVVITDMMNHWPAMSKVRKKTNYFHTNSQSGRLNGLKRILVI